MERIKLQHLGINDVFIEKDNEKYTLCSNFNSTKKNK